jgi:hypothetical protein
MTTAARDVLKAFEALAPAEQQEVAAEILRRATPEGDLPDAAFDELATDLFRHYDAEESARGGA